MPVTAMSISLLPHLEQTSRSRQSRTVVSAPYRCAWAADRARSVPEVASLLSSRRPVKACGNPWRRLVLAHLEHAASRLDLGPDAPPRNEGARERRIREIEGDSVIQHPAHSRRRHCPPIRPAILVQPGGNLSMAPT